MREEAQKNCRKSLGEQKNRILGALARLDDFLMNPLIHGHSGTAPEMSRNALSTSQGTNEDDSQSDPDPEAGIFHNQTTQKFGPEDGHDSDSEVKPWKEGFSLIVKNRQTSSNLNGFRWTQFC